MRYIKSLIIILVNLIINRILFYKIFHKIVCLMPTTKICNFERFPNFLLYYQLLFSIARSKINNKSTIERERIATMYIIPSIIILFNKNYVNYAQILLLTIEEYFLSKNTESYF